MLASGFLPLRCVNRTKVDRGGVASIQEALTDLLPCALQLCCCCERCSGECISCLWWPRERNTVSRKGVCEETQKKRATRSKSVVVPVRVGGVPFVNFPRTQKRLLVLSNVELPGTIHVVSLAYRKARERGREISSVSVDPISCIIYRTVTGAPHTCKWSRSNSFFRLPSSPFDS